MSNTLIALLVFAVSLVMSTVTYPRVLRFAKSHNIVDNPNARKLQRVPVPVMGGLVVFIGILFGVMVLSIFVQEPLVMWGLGGMAIMLVTGMWDDMVSLPASFRFGLEVVLVGVLIWQTGIYIDDFHGLWGIHKLEPWFAYTLSIVVGVGLINVTNMIDGVDGYSSGVGILASFCFALLFMQVWSPVMVSLAVIVIGALLPFFMHNVFGIRSKMFIGDGGTMMLGMMMVLFVFYSLSSRGRCASLEADEVGLIAFVLAVISIPWFDTMRVVFMRIQRGNAPFKPDKTHLHHLFIDMGFSHLGAAAAILTMNLMVILSWLVTWLLGGSIDVQTYVVAGLSSLLSFGFYKLMKIQQNGGPLDEEGYPQGTPLWHMFCRLGAMSHREKGRAWRFLRGLMDHGLLQQKKKNLSRTRIR